MFEALAVLSKGGDPSDILAEMGESLETAMQRLADILQEFQGAVEANNENSGFSMGDLNPFNNNNSDDGGSRGSGSVNFPSQMAVKITNLRALARTIKENS